MKTESLRDQVKTYYERQRMSSEKVERLTTMLRAAGHPMPTAKPVSIWRRIADWVDALGPRWVPAAATGLVAVVMLNVGAWYSWQGDADYRINAGIAREIAMNHFKNLAPEYQATSIETLRRVMPALDFEPYTPNQMDQLGLLLTGARYCSIQGHLALQIKLMDASGRRHTIYQAPYLPPLQNIQKAKVSLDGIQITMWNENGIFTGLASPTTQSK